MNKHNDNMKYAVSGASGFLGSHIVSSLLERGLQVKVLIRDEKKRQDLPKGLSEIIVGDICDENTLYALTEDVDIVIHTVSNFRTASGPPESYTHTNYLGTKKILAAAKKANVKRFVYCSTIGVHGSIEVTPANESSPFAPGDLYQSTKLQAEKHCVEQVGKSAMEIVMVRPCSMYGPGDMRMLKMFKMLSKRLFLMIGACSENFHAVYIDDIVEGFSLAATTPEIDGEIFIIGGDEYVPLKQYVTFAAQAVNAPYPILRFPYWFMISAAWVCETLFVPLRVEPPLHRSRVRFYKNNRAFDISKAKKLLAYEPKYGLEEGMRKTVLWYKNNGYL